MHAGNANLSHASSETELCFEPVWVWTAWAHTTTGIMWTKQLIHLCVCVSYVFVFVFVCVRLCFRGFFNGGKTKYKIHDRGIPWVSVGFRNSVGFRGIPWNSAGFSPGCKTHFSRNVFFTKRIFCNPGLGWLYSWSDPWDKRTKRALTKVSRKRVNNVVSCTYVQQHQVDKLISAVVLQTT